MEKDCLKNSKLSILKARPLDPQQSTLRRGERRFGRPSSAARLFPKRLIALTNVGEIAGREILLTMELLTGCQLNLSDNFPSRFFCVLQKILAVFLFSTCRLNCGV